MVVILNTCRIQQICQKRKSWQMDEKKTKKTSQPFVLLRFVTAVQGSV